MLRVLNRSTRRTDLYRQCVPKHFTSIAVLSNPAPATSLVVHVGAYDVVRMVKIGVVGGDVSYGGRSFACVVEPVTLKTLRFHRAVT